MRYIGEDDITPVVSVDQFINAVHGEMPDAAERSSIELLLGAAQDVVTTAANIPPAPGLYEFTYPLYGWRRWWFPCCPVTSISALAVTDYSGAWVDQALDGVMLVQGEDEPQLLLPERWAANEAGRTLRIQAEIGGVFPRNLWRAVVALAREWREADISVSGDIQTPRASFSVQRLIRQARYVRPNVSAGC
ncbi:hypothetical protein PVT71_18310 [Salipiger sp. H15]|uniref:Phage gp6-like head-tail connector protein n=1 Tax=Alloyangia sp. H15 TaxID=3029062 RepID=A0AAU8AR51_9RHOB